MPPTKYGYCECWQEDDDGDYGDGGEGDGDDDISKCRPQTMGTVNVGKKMTPRMFQSDCRDKPHGCMRRRYTHDRANTIHKKSDDDLPM